ncbi:hypothetical protein A8F94_01280 [Bacillus sp. FJAT-27225]|uniref:hypothetical protein n=1 Tax=Bacillus sp. FJAT-27225 TaxID=1743144 RepID=UPI00080C2F2E|nr:hypothetical protein [Bacillus sp. FJAT-27225]OCA90544.1 hypothetical protein A8F94_01280 [Bacillus sp. FJAT-27225]
MVGLLIMVCEIMFWIMIVAGLFARYIVKKKKLGAVLLLSTPVIDFVLLVATVIDLQSGSEASFIHGLAAYYIGMTIAFGEKMIQWADERFAYRFAGGPKPAQKPKIGSEHAKLQRHGFHRHLLGWVIGNALLGAMILLIGIGEQTAALKNVMFIWGVVLAVDFLISYSHTVFPRKNEKQVSGQNEV